MFKVISSKYYARKIFECQKKVVKILLQEKAWGDKIAVFKKSKVLTKCGQVKNHMWFRKYSLRKILNVVTNLGFEFLILSAILVKVHYWEMSKTHHLSIGVTVLSERHLILLWGRKKIVKEECVINKKIHVNDGRQLIQKNLKILLNLYLKYWMHWK